MSHRQSKRILNRALKLLRREYAAGHLQHLTCRAYTHAVAAYRKHHY